MTANGGLYRVLPLHDSAEIFTTRTAAWHNEVIAVRSWYQSKHDNWSTIAGQRSRWAVWNAALDIAKNSVVQIQTYLQRISEGTHTVCFCLDCLLSMLRRRKLELSSS